MVRKLSVLVRICFVVLHNAHIDNTILRRHLDRRFMLETGEISALVMPKPTTVTATPPQLKNFDNRNSAHRNEACLLSISPGSESSLMSAMSTCCGVDSCGITI